KAFTRLPVAHVQGCKEQPGGSGNQCEHERPADHRPGKAAPAIFNYRWRRYTTRLDDPKLENAETKDQQAGSKMDRARCNEEVSDQRLFGWQSCAFTV